MSPVPDDGFTLIELIVYVGLFAIVLAIVGGFMISSLKMERDVRLAADATTAAQLVSTSVQAGVRNGTAVTVTNAAVGDSQMLLVRTFSRDVDATETCQAWFFSAEDSAVYTKSTTNPPTPILIPTSSPAGTWTLLASGVTRVKLEPTPAPTPGAVPLVPLTIPVFTFTSKSASLSFEVAAGDRKPVRLETAAYLRVEIPESAPCF